MNIVLSQPCGKIFVGDPHQQIYTFRGAVNALFTVPHTHVFYLTQVSLSLLPSPRKHISEHYCSPASFSTGYCAPGTAQGFTSGAECVANPRFAALALCASQGACGVRTVLTGNMPLSLCSRLHCRRLPVNQGGGTKWCWQASYSCDALGTKQRSSSRD